MKKFLMSILALIAYISTIVECYSYNGSNFSFFDIHFLAWIPIIVLVILSFVYGIMAINEYKMKKQK